MLQNHPRTANTTLATPVVSLATPSVPGPGSNFPSGMPSSFTPGETCFPFGVKWVIWKENQEEGCQLSTEPWKSVGWGWGNFLHYNIRTCRLFLSHSLWGFCAGPFGSHRYTQVHTGTHRYTQVHTGTHRLTTKCRSASVLLPIGIPAERIAIRFNYGDNVIWYLIWYFLNTSWYNR